jgi:hypothetical protein
MINGMIANGFIVRSLTHVENEPLAYGLFDTEDSAKAWADKMSLPVVVEPIYAPVYNRG